MKNLAASNVLLNVLCLEDDLKDAELLNEMLVNAGYVVSMDIAKIEKEYVEFLKGKNYDIILSDYSLPGYYAPAALQMAKKLQPEVPFICFSGTIGEDKAVELLKQGATDYVLKDRPDRLTFSVRRALEGVGLQKERKIAEDKLKESQERLNLFFSQSLDGFFFMMLDEPIVWDNSIEKEKALDYVFKHQSITKANKAMLDQYGATEEQYIGLTPADAFRHDIKQGREIWKDFFDKGHLHIDTHEKKFDGTDMIIEGDYICLYDSQKRIIGHFGIQREVTAIRRADELLRKSKSELEEYFENDISADYVVSLEGEIFSCNKTFLKMFGFEKKSHTEKFDITQLYKNPADRIEMLRRVKQNGRVEDYEVEYLTKDGKSIFAFVNAIGIFNDQGELIQIRGYIVDLTDRKNAEEKLKESERKFKEMANLLPQVIFETDENGILTYVNEVSFKLFGYSEEELSKKLTALQMIDPKDRVLAATNIQLIMNGAKPSTHEYNALRKDGTNFPVLIYSSAKVNDGRVLGLRGTIIDITERKKAEESLLKLSHAVEQSPVSIVITDKDGNIEYGNPKAVEITGYKPEEIIGKNSRIFQSGEKTKSEYKILWDTISSGKEWFGEFHNKKKNGELYWEMASISPILNEKGEITHYVAVKEDITKRKKIEKELLRSEYELKKAQQITHIGSWYLDIETEEVVWTEELYKMYGFDSALPPPPYNEHMKLFTPESWELLSASLTRTRVTGVPYELELETVRKDGTNGWMWVRGETELDKEGKTIGLWGAAQDISQRKQNEKDLIVAKERAEESDRLKSAFLANMSHEIRTPMNGILGFAGLLKEAELSGEQQQHYIQIIEKSGARMLNIINDIVSISKIESGIIEIYLSETNINKQLQFVYDSLKLDADNKKLNLYFNCALTEKEAIIKTDSEKFYSILSNLVKNAIKYTDAGSIEFGYAHKGEEFEFYVKDTGIGIPKDKQEAIFERFIQADIVDKMARQGAGLGLAISRAYVEMLGGKIWVESEEGKGSTFYFSLPYNGEPKQKTLTENDVPAATEIHLKNLKVLIVEDDETSTMLISIMVKPFSKEILKVNTGSEAVDTCRNNPDIDLILMDIQMPEMSGYEATRQVRQFNKEVVIIAQTAYGLSGDRAKAIKAGCNDYISKPINKTLLYELIKKHCCK